MAFESSQLSGWNLAAGDAPAVPINQAVALPYPAPPCTALPFDPMAWEGGNVLKRFPALAAAQPSGDPGSFYLWYSKNSSCYSHALGDLTLFTQRVAATSNPGIIGGQPIDKKEITCDGVIEAAKIDGLKLTGDKVIFEENSRPVALFWKPGDSHWLRLDKGDSSSELLWTEKFRYMLPQIVRRNQRLVQDPRTIEIPHSNGTYRFVCFFNVPKNLSMSAETLKHYRQDKNINPQFLRHEYRAQRLDGSMPIFQFG